MIKFREILDEAKYYGKHPKSVLQSLISSLNSASEAAEQLKSFKKKADYDPFWGDISEELKEVETKINQIKDIIDKNLK